MSSIAIIDYGMGNLRSVQKGFEKVGHNAFVTNNPVKIANADGVVLPGVGAFKDCMKNLEDLALVDTIKEVILQGKPFLGICLGLQLLFTKSEEFGEHRGLDIIQGKVKHFDLKGSEFKVPHMGWNCVRFNQKSPLFKGVEDNSFFYFVHSYYVEPDLKDMESSQTDYGQPFCSSIWADNVYAVQFHPEKSQGDGLKILKNFGELC